jgi:endoglucanase
MKSVAYKLNRMLWVVLLLLIPAFSVVQAQDAPAAAVASTVPQSRLDKLSSGVNLSFAFYCDPSCYNPTKYDDQLDDIRAAGLRHVRMIITWDLIEDGAGGINETTYVDLLRFIRLARQNSLAVIVDVHNTGIRENGTGEWTGNYMWGIIDLVVGPRYLEFWRVFSARLNADTNPEWVFIQPANEPIYDDYTGGPRTVWYEYQNQLLTIIREGAPRHTIFFAPHAWQQVDAVWSIPVPTDGNIIYDFHFYEPLDFTHQCQDFVGTTDQCSNPYPGSYNSWDGQAITLDRAYIETRMRVAFDWAARNGNAALHFSEFGVSAGAPREDAARYLTDGIDVMQSLDIGFSLFEWNQNFGFSQDPITLNAVKAAISS